MRKLRQTLVSKLDIESYVKKKQKIAQYGVINNHRAMVGNQRFAKQVDRAPQHIVTLPIQRDTRMPVPHHALPDRHTNQASSPSSPRHTTLHRRNADSILARVLICPFCTFLGPSPSSFPLKLATLVDASPRWYTGDFGAAEWAERSLMVSSLGSLGFRERCLREGGWPKISPKGLGCIPRGSSWSI